MPTIDHKHTSMALLAALFLVSASWASAQSGSGALKVTSFPSGAKVFVDGEDTGKVTPMSVSLPTGDHVIVVSLPNTGWSPDTRTVTVVSGNNDLSVTLLPTLTAGPQGPMGPKGDKGDGEGVLAKIRQVDVSSWNYVGHDARAFRHYGPTAQDFYAAFGHDGVGAVGSPTRITSTDIDGILLAAVKAIEQRTERLRLENERLKALVEELRHELRGAR